MTIHALKRINERYGNHFTMEDINILCSLMRKGQYLEIVNDFNPKDKITVLIRYNNIPLKLIYAQKQKAIVTALPLDIDEFNEYFDLVPNINTNSESNEYSEKEVIRLRMKFADAHCNKETYNGYNLEQVIKCDTNFYIKNMSEKFVVVWFKKSDKIFYQLYSKKALQKRLWHLIIKGFREKDNKLLTNTVSLYAKIFK